MDSSDSDTDEDEEEKSGDESEDGGDDDPNGTNALIKAAQETNATKLKAERKEKRKAEKAEMLRLAEKRKKDIKLNQLKTISGTNALKGPLMSKGSKQKAGEFKSRCYRCGHPGHLIADCPEEASSDHIPKARDILGSNRSRKTD